MSNPAFDGDKGNGPANVREYLSRQWNIDPFQQSDEVIARRRDLLDRQNGLDQQDGFDRQDGSSEALAPPSQADREQALQLFDETRKNFWSMEPDEIRSSLESSKLRKFADLLASAQRLLDALAFRQDLLILGRNEHAGPLYEILMQMIPSRPREWASLHESVLRRVVLGVGEKGRTAYWKPERTLRGNAKRIRKEFPAIYDYFRDLIDDILTAGSIKSSFLSTRN